MGFPRGQAADGDGGIVVSQAWRRLRVQRGHDGAAAIAPVLADLPRNPARIVPTRDADD